MMFTFYIPEEEVKPNKKKHILTQAEYWVRDKGKLSSFTCPNCVTNELFRGHVYIGCFNCLNYFSEDEIIEANGGLI